MDPNMGKGKQRRRGGRIMLWRAALSGGVSGGLCAVAFILSRTTTVFPDAIGILKVLALFNAVLTLSYVYEAYTGGAKKGDNNGKANATINSQYQREAERDLERDLELVKQATPGPWVMELFDHDVAVKTVEGQAIIYRPSGMRSIHIKNDDWVFITEAREGWPYAIEEALTQSAYVKVMKEILEDILPLAKKYSCAYTDVTDEDRRIWTEICKEITSVLNIHDGIE